MFNTPKDAEADIENMKVAAIERHGKDTVIILAVGEGDIWLRCTLEKHNQILARFRKKIGLS
jgi:hypothetical protein